MYIKTNDLIDFRSNAGSIHTDKLNPILSYLHLNGNILTKYNLESFISQEIDTDNVGVLLIEERIINNFLDSPEADIIDVRVIEKKVIYSYNPDSTTWHGLPSEEVYPALPESGSITETEIDAALIAAIKTASNFIIDEAADSRTMRSFVMVGSGLVSATDGMIAYFQKIDFGVPQMLLTAQQIQTIASSAMLHFSDYGNHIFFRCGKIMYGFIKPETKFVDMTKYAVSPDGTDFMVPKRELLIFNDRAGKTSVDKNPKAIMHVGNNEIVFELDDDKYATGTRKRVVTICDPRPPYKYLIPHLSRLLRAIEGDEVFFSYGQKKYFITTDDSFVAMMIEMD